MEAETIIAPALLRKTRDGAFCWQSKPARRRIREGCDAAGNVASRLGVYCALTEIASDEASEEFTTTVAHIAARSGFADRCVRASIQDLADLGLIQVETPALKAPSRYRLLSVRQEVPNDRQEKPDVRLFVPSDRHPANFATMPPVEETERKTKKRVKKYAPAQALNGASFEIPSSLNTPAFLQLWATWRAYWTEAVGRCGAMPSTVANKHLAVLAPLGADVAARWLDNAICRGLREPMEPFAPATPSRVPERSGASQDSARKPAPVVREPEGWREFIETEFPGCAYCRGGDQETTPWDGIDSASRARILEAMRQRGAAA